MKPKSFILPTAVAAAVALSPLFLSNAEEPISPVGPPPPAKLDEETLKKIDPELLKKLELLPVEGPQTGFQPVPPPAPVIPEGTKSTEELEKTIQLINDRLIAPMQSHSNKRVLMSRVRVRMDVEYHFAITDTSESLFPFDVYRRHLRGWEKIASGVAHAGMGSVKLKMPKTGEMVDPIKHPLFAVALTEWKKVKGKAS